MSSFTEFIFSPVYTLIAQPWFPLFIAAVLAIAVVSIIVYIVVRVRTRAARHIDEMAQNFASNTQELRIAEKIGKYGSFTWNYENPGLSYWSEEMYHLHGLVPRMTPPPIDTIIKLVRSEDIEKATEGWGKAQSQPGDFSISYRIVLPSKEEKFVRVQGKTVLVDDKPRTIRGVVHDVTKEMEIDQAKTEFVSLASHQLKTPLTSIKWFAEALLGGGAGQLTPDQTTYITKIQEENQRMMDMINDLLNVSRMELGTLIFMPVELSVAEVAKSALDEQMQTAQSKNITVKFTVDPSVPVMYADKNLFRMVFQNLISNAIKYTPAHGTVECEVTPGAIRNDTITIRVSDTGIGIPKEDQDRVFQKLHRAKNAREQIQDGTGLGLYMVKAIIDRAGGTITFDSVEGKGTTFMATIPLVWKATETGSKPLAGAAENKS